MAKYDCSCPKNFRTFHNCILVIKWVKWDWGYFKVIFSQMNRHVVSLDWSVFGSVLSPERSTEKKVVWYQRPKKLHCILIHVAKLFITNIALHTDLCIWISMNTNPLWMLLFDLFYCTLCLYKNIIKDFLCLKNLTSVFVMLCSMWKHFEKGNLNALRSYVFK